MVVLDSWALLAYLKDEPAAARIEDEWLADRPSICSINLGEVFFILVRDLGAEAAAEQVELVRRNSTLVAPDWDLIAEAARLKATGRLAYADAFCIATAQRLDGPLWTGDPEIIDRAEECAAQSSICASPDRLGNPSRR